MLASYTTTTTLMVVLFGIIPKARTQVLPNCPADNCKNGGTCEVTSTSFVCRCPAGFSGVDCQTRACTPSSCVNGGTCVQSNGNQFVCLCPRGFVGRTCEQNVGGCTCLNGGSCLQRNSGRSFCLCVKGFEGDNCEVRKSSANPCSQTICHNGGSCIKTADGSICFCASGFRGQNCNESTADRGICINTHTLCTQWAAQGECTSQYGRAIMVQRCPLACRLCVPTGTPRPRVAGTCSPNPCINGQCQEVNFNDRGYTCVCADGFSGARCELNFDVCSANPCNGHQCTRGPRNNIVCTCSDGFLGDRCEVDLCRPNPCNVGLCRRISAGFICQCPPSAYGRNCERSSESTCNSNPCQNGGTCMAANNGYVCFCVDGYAGNHCDIGCRDTYIMVPNQSMIRSHEADINSCERYCNSDDLCVGFDYQPPNGFSNGMCFLSYSDRVIMSSPGVNRYIRQKCGEQTFPVDPPRPNGQPARVTPDGNAIGVTATSTRRPIVTPTLPDCEPTFTITNNTMQKLGEALIIGGMNETQCVNECRRRRSGCIAADFIMALNYCLIVSKSGYTLEGAAGVRHYQKQSCDNRPIALLAGEQDENEQDVDEKIVKWITPEVSTPKPKKGTPKMTTAGWKTPPPTPKTTPWATTRARPTRGKPTPATKAPKP